MHKLIQEVVAHYADLRRSLSKELRDPHRAEDIAQSSFERVYRQALDTTAAPIDAPRALLFRVARNLCIDELRHRQVAQSWAQQHGDSQTALGAFAAPSSEYLVAQRQLLARVVAVLEGLPQLRREVFLQYRAHGYSRAEIAQRLNLSEAAVAKHLVRAAVDCSRVFAELRSQMPEPHYPANAWRPSPALAEDGA